MSGGRLELVWRHIMAELGGDGQGVLGGSWAVISGVKSRVRY